MIWTKLSPVFVLLLLLLQGCGIYSFSGISLPPEVKTFSVCLKSNVALGPPDLVEKFQKRLSDELAQRTFLKQVETQGDLQLEGCIQQFNYTSIAPTKKEDSRDAFAIDRLTIELKISYFNSYQKDTSFTKKKFSQCADMAIYASRSDEEPRLIDEIFDKLVKDIFNETIASW